MSVGLRFLGSPGLLDMAKSAMIAERSGFRIRVDFRDEDHA